MPDVDGGHYFLTVLAPVRTDTVQYDVGRTRTHASQLAQKLALVPTGRQGAGLPADAWPSPFSRNTINHFARFAIIDQPHFNGRIGGDALVGAITGRNPMDPQADDRLTTPFLLFGADFDAQGLTESAALRRYTDALWSTMQQDLGQIFAHCTGFEGVDTPQAFFNYIRRCQIETTMPFNDYWAYGLKAADGAPPVLRLALTGAAALVALIWLSSAVTAGSGFFWPVFAALLGLTLWGVVRWIGRAGARPFPTAPDSDLPSILKGLFLQQHLTRLATEVQGLDDAALHARFGAFLAVVRPGELNPTQNPGLAHSDPVEWTR